MKIDQNYPNVLQGPFDSPLEESFANAICKTLKSEIEIDTQVDIITQLGRFRADFVIISGNFKLLIELDGKEYHKGSYDIWRDAFILGEKHVDAILRFKGKDVVHNINECIYFISKLYPQLFTKRSIINLSVLIEPENIQSIDSKISENEFECVDKFYLPIYCNVDDRLELFPSIEVTLQKQNSNGFWKKFYDFAISIKSLSIEELNKKYFH